MEKPVEKKSEKDSTKESVENGQKAIEFERQLKTDKDPKKAKEEEQKDAEAWRNEG